MLSIVGGDNDIAMIFMVHRVKLPRKLNVGTAKRKRKRMEQRQREKGQKIERETMKKSGVIFMIAIIIRHMCKIQH